ncbi:MAG TPA: RNA-binding protein [Rhizomicrobium sp.]
MEETEHGSRASGARSKRTRAQESSDGSRADARERRDIVSGTVMPENRLLRFVVGPDGKVVPDVAAKLPGRGLWVEASKSAITKAVEKKLFSRAAKAQVGADADLAERAQKALVTRMLGDLGIARRAGSLVLGFDNVLRQLEGPKPPKVLIEAFDGAADGKRKLYAAAHRLTLDCVVIETLTSAELGLALGRENVIHAAVQPGGLADRLMFDAERLLGFRSRSERDS